MSVVAKVYVSYTTQKELKNAIKQVDEVLGNLEQFEPVFRAQVKSALTKTRKELVADLTKPAKATKKAKKKTSAKAKPKAKAVKKAAPKTKPKAKAAKKVAKFTNLWNK